MKWIVQNTDFQIVDSWVTADARADRPDERWLNGILKKKLVRK